MTHGKCHDLYHDGTSTLTLNKGEPSLYISTLRSSLAHFLAFFHFRYLPYILSINHHQVVVSVIKGSLGGFVIDNRKYIIGKF